MRWLAILFLLLCACGETGPTDQPDAGGITRGVRGTGPVDGGGIWAFGFHCDQQTVSLCPFQADGGNCYSTAGSVGFCGMPCDNHGAPNCPPGSRCGALVDIPLCVKDCAGPADCPAFTNCYNGSCVAF